MIVRLQPEAGRHGTCPFIVTVACQRSRQADRNSNSRPHVFLEGQAMYGNRLRTQWHPNAMAEFPESVFDKLA
jgi:hypothetical protein